MPEQIPKTVTVSSETLIELVAHLDAAQALQSIIMADRSGPPEGFLGDACNCAHELAKEGFGEYDWVFATPDQPSRFEGEGAEAADRAFRRSDEIVVQFARDLLEDVEQHEGSSRGGAVLTVAEDAALERREKVLLASQRVRAG
jgi:hypothetical protein